MGFVDEQLQVERESQPRELEVCHRPDNPNKLTAVRPDLRRSRLYQAGSGKSKTKGPSSETSSACDEGLICRSAQLPPSKIRINDRRLARLDVCSYDVFPQIAATISQVAWLQVPTP
jgi:hypothetical protein